MTEKPSLNPQNFPATNSTELDEVFGQLLARFMRLAQRYNPSFNMALLSPETVSTFIAKVNSGVISIEEFPDKDLVLLKLMVLLMNHNLYDWRDGFCFDFNLNENQKRIVNQLFSDLVEMALRSEKEGATEKYLEIIATIFPEWLLAIKYRQSIQKLMINDNEGAESTQTVLPTTFSEFVELINKALEQGIEINFLSQLHSELLRTPLVNEEGASTLFSFTNEALQQLSILFNRGLLIGAKLDLDISNAIDMSEEVYQNTHNNDDYAQEVTDFYSEIETVIEEMKEIILRSAETRN